MSKKRKKNKSRFKIPVKKRVLSYSPAEMKAIESHIENVYGPIEAIIHDQNSRDIHIDLCLVAPDNERPYWKIVTMGMGKYKMTPSSDQSYLNTNLNRCELVLAVEPDWDYRNLYPLDPHINFTKPNGNYVKSYKYPVQVLLNLAKLPFRDKFLLAPLITTELPGIEFDVQTDLDEFLILWTQDLGSDEEIVSLPNGEQVVFHQVVPITHRERIAMSNPVNFEKTINRIPYIFYPERISTV